MGYSSAFDDLLAQGRQELDRMTGRGDPAPAGAAPAPADPVVAGAGRRGVTIEGTARGIPFRLRVGERQ